MSFSWVSPKITEMDGPDQADRTRYVARQPIMDLRGIVYGYELLFRSGPESLFSGDSDLATRTMIDNSLLFGLEKLSPGLPAFFNCTSASLTENLVDMLPASQSVLEIHESIEPTAPVIESCRRLKAAGFRLALDNFTWRAGIEPLLELADYVKIDCKANNKEERLQLWEKLEGRAVIRIAEKVETQPDYRQACKEGFTLFQGYYFCFPTMLKNRKIPPNRLGQIAILELLHKNPLDMRQLSDRLKKDAGLTYRLLRLVNSPLYSLRERISSIDGALLVIGEDTFRRVATLAIANELGADQPIELLRMAFVRGRFCETSAGLLGLDATEQYLLGLLSLIPAMLRVPIGILTRSLPLREAVKEALNGAHNIEHALLHWIEGLENGDWESCDQVTSVFGFDQTTLVKNYSEAVVWAENALGASA